MNLMPDSTVFQKRLAALPLATYKIGETVLAAGSKTGRLLILKKGAVITADVHAVETSQFHIADAGLLVQDPIVLLYVAGLLAGRLDNATKALVELKGQVQAGRPSSEIGKTLEKIEVLLSPSGASLVYAGYPYDPYA